MKPSMVLEDKNYHIISNEVSVYADENSKLFYVGIDAAGNTMSFKSSKTISNTFFVRL
jgi:hypothetical protein